MRKVLILALVAAWFLSVAGEASARCGRGLFRHRCGGRIHLFHRHCR
jgi:hypothetical protein